MCRDVVTADSWSPACWTGSPASHIISSRSRSLQYLFQPLLRFLEASPLFSLTPPWVGSTLQKGSLTACPQTPRLAPRALVHCFLPVLCCPLRPGTSACRLPSAPGPPQVSLDHSRPSLAMCSPPHVLLSMSSVSSPFESPSAAPGSLLLA